MRKGLQSVGAGVRGTTRKNKIEANTDPRKLLDRISTNHKDIAHKEQTGNTEPVQPEGKEPDLVPSKGKKRIAGKARKQKIAIKKKPRFHSSHYGHQGPSFYSLALALLHLNNEISLNTSITALSPASRRANFYREMVGKDLIPIAVSTIRSDS
ncbi:hypothetical protein PSTG_04341 [Puccinia striiformis f. sp. tritici PST-78]|uniref:Uncharacterized protein n=1 Tax=Puccinia striiformis f. sp. tritici PST-78 TaxID=1165861 RepID=A0A0L0VTW5_9BASI|nr:hypothetical protein PSTG_04341 [Puccinia striiformis f. sp. tritici PST-78]